MRTRYTTSLDENMRQTFQKTAEYLSGKSVILLFAKPLAKGADAECYQDKDGIIRINIAPHLDIQKAYNVALHEIAHAKLNHNQTPMTPAQYQLTVYDDARQFNKQPNQKAFESEADILADRWIDWAHAHIKHVLKWYTTPDQRAVMNMTSLLFYEG